MSSGRTSVFIEVPMLCSTVEVMVVPTEPVSKLIERVLNMLNMVDVKNIGLFGKSTDLKLFQPNEPCENVFTFRCDSYALLLAEVKTVKIYYENQPATICCEKNANVRQIIAIAADCLCMDINSDYIVAVDPVANCVCKMNQNIYCDVLVLIRLNVFSIDMVFDLKELAGFEDVQYLLTMSKLMLTNQMKNLFSLVKSRRYEEIQFDRMDKNKIKDCLKKFMDDVDLSSLEPGVQNALLFVLISSSPNPLIPKKLHEMALETVDLKSDILRIEKTIAFLCYLPLASYILLMELVQIFGGIIFDEPIRKLSIQLITETFFPNIINRESEIKFVSFLLMYYQILFRFPQRGNREFRVDQDDKVYVVEFIDQKRLIWTEDGESSVDYDTTIPLDFKPDIETILDKFTNREKNEIQDVSDDLILLNSRIENIFNLLSNCVLGNNMHSAMMNFPKRIESQTFLPFDFSNYAISELPTQIISEVSPIIIDDSTKTDLNNSKVFSFDSSLLEPNNNVKSPVKRKKVLRMNRKERAVKFHDIVSSPKLSSPPPLVSTAFNTKNEQNGKERTNSLIINTHERNDSVNSLNNFEIDEDSLDEFTDQMQYDFTETDYSSFSTLPDLSQTSIDSSIICNFDNIYSRNDPIELYDKEETRLNSSFKIDGLQSDDDFNSSKEDYYSYSNEVPYSDEDEEKNFGDKILKNDNN